jgi:ABC-type transport system involved in Fe-S cluster assembly fused permease/ATPase subunit
MHVCALADAAALRSIMDSDKVLVLDNGTVAEFGTGAPSQMLLCFVR